MPDFRELRQSDIHRMLDAWEDAHPEPFEPQAAGPDEDTLRAWFVSARLHQDWRYRPWWERWFPQVLLAFGALVFLSVVFALLFMAAGA